METKEMTLSQFKKTFLTVYPIDTNGVQYEAKPCFIRSKNFIKDNMRCQDVELKGGLYRFEEFSPCKRLYGGVYFVHYYKLKI